MPRRGHSAYKVFSFWRADVDRALQEHRGPGITVSYLQAQRELRTEQRKQAATDGQARAEAKRAYMQGRRGPMLFQAGMLPPG